MGTLKAWLPKLAFFTKMDTGLPVKSLDDSHHQEPATAPHISIFSLQLKHTIQLHRPAALCILARNMRPSPAGTPKLLISQVLHM